MKFNMTERYAMICMGYLGKQSKGRSVKAEEIAQEFGITFDFLLIVLNRLTRSGLLQSKRGPCGGFSLAKPASEISLLEILEAVGGHFRDSYRIAADAKNQPFARRADAVRDKAADQAIAILKKAKLSDMLR